ncbi:MAG: folate-binding protein YgfZ [Congregibacter sp.]
MHLLNQIRSPLIRANTLSIYASQLPAEALIHLRGQNIPAFLQGQLTCDTRKLSPTQAVSGAFCNVKGRVISDVDVIQRNEAHCLLRVRRSVALGFAAALQRYAQFSRISVEVDQRSDALQGVYTPLTGDEQAFAGLPIGALSPGHIDVCDDTVYFQRNDQQVELIGLLGRPRTPAGCAPGTEQAWRMQLLRSGHFSVEQEDSEAFTPQTLNYDLSGLVAFDKGCYTGQEVIARLHYKGKSKRRLQIYSCVMPALAAKRDDPISGTDGRAIGRVLCVETSAGEAAVLAAEVLAAELGAPAQLSTGGELSPLTPLSHFPNQSPKTQQ